MSVRERRLRLGMSQRQLADLAGVSRGTVRNIEAGQPQRDTTRSVLDAALARAEGFRASVERAPGDPCTCEAAATLRAIRALLDGMGGAR